MLGGGGEYLPNFPAIVGWEGELELIDGCQLCNFHSKICIIAFLNRPFRLVARQMSSNKNLL